mmetsp:Transcript_21125/g.43481  ORF Transcript_21125/g.43481 Transcript_21125/m.43481 type:complete len:254 (-) Transcript_21125:96-857(-)
MLADLQGREARRHAEHVYFPGQDDLSHRRDHDSQRTTPSLQRGIRLRKTHDRHHESCLCGRIRMQLYLHHPHKHLRKTRQLFDREGPRDSRFDPQMLQGQTERHSFHDLGKRNTAPTVCLQPRSRRAHGMGHPRIQRTQSHHSECRRGRRSDHQGRCPGRSKGNEVRGQGRIRYQQERRPTQKDCLQQQASKVSSRLQIYNNARWNTTIRRLVCGQLRDCAQINNSVATKAINIVFVAFCKRDVDSDLLPVLP